MRLYLTTEVVYVPLYCVVKCRSCLYGVGGKGALFDL